MAVIGAIIGDIIGSQFEFDYPVDMNAKTVPLFTDKCKFTDDTVMTLATKWALLYKKDFAEAYKTFGRKYPNAGYGSMFDNWIWDDGNESTDSYGNGAAMRISAIPEYSNSIWQCKGTTSKSVICSHNHSESIKGAIVTSNAIWDAIHSKKGNLIIRKSSILGDAIAAYPKGEYTYSPIKTLDEMRKTYKWDCTCQTSVPLAIRCVYEANSYEEFIRNVLSFKCDTDTICAIGGGIAEELFGGTGFDNEKILKQYLPQELFTLATISNAMSDVKEFANYRKKSPH